MPSAPAVKIVPSAAWLVSVLLTIALVSLSCRAHAEVSNARISGDVKKLGAIISRAASGSCGGSQCRLLNGIIRLTVSTANNPALALRLTHARIPTEIIRDSILNDAATRPILMRGYTRVRHAGPHGETVRFPVAATIYRDPGHSVLEIAVPRIRRRATVAGLLLVKGQLSKLSSSSRNARAQFASSTAFSARHCGLHTTEALSGTPTGARISEYSDVTALTSYNVIYIGTDYDAQFASAVRCGTVSACQNKIVSIINQAAVFYENQFNYTLQVARQFGPTSYGSTTNSDTLLDTVQVYNLDNRFQYFHTGSNTTLNQFDIFQFFTGRTLDRNIIGKAYRDTACRNSQSQYAESLVQHTTSSLDPVVSAHEFGHTLGAAHVPSGIMKPNLGDPPPQSFASASVTAISNFLSNYYTECRQGVLDSVSTPIPTPISTSTPTPSLKAPVTLSLAVRTAGKQRISISYRVTSIAAGCLVSIRAASTASKAKSGTVITQRDPNTGILSISVPVKTGVTPAKNGDPNVYFKAEYSCADGSILETSKVTKLNPKRIKSTRGRVSKSTWIGRLKKAIPQ
jgi:hypothetical protein